MKKLCIGLLIAILLLTGCSSTSGNSYDSNVAEEQEAAMEAPMEAPIADGVEFGDEVGFDETQETVTDQKLIKEGNMRVTVSDSVEAARLIEERVVALGGYVAGTSKYSQYYDGQEYYSIDMNIRVPGESFDFLVGEVEGLGKVDNSSTNVQDVTQQYIDLEARLKNLKSEEERFVAIFDQADTVEDMLAVESELARLRGEIESLEGQFRYLNNRVSYASLYLTLDEERIKTAEFEGLSLGQVFKEMGSAFSRGVYGFFVFIGDLFVQLAYMLPFLISIALIAWLAFVLGKRLRKKSKDKPRKVEKQSKESDKNDQA